MSIIGEDEMDARFKVMSLYLGLQHFKKGILFISQWTGTEHQQMQRVFVTLMAGSVLIKVLMVVQALIDFIYYAQFQSYTTETLASLQRPIGMVVLWSLSSLSSLCWCLGWLDVGGGGGGGWVLSVVLLWLSAIVSILVVLILFIILGFIVLIFVFLVLIILVLVLITFIVCWFMSLVAMLFVIVVVAVGSLS
jgi:hypothetical protein